MRTTSEHPLLRKETLYQHVHILSDDNGKRSHYEFVLVSFTPSNGFGAHSSRLPFANRHFLIPPLLHHTPALVTYLLITMLLHLVSPLGLDHIPTRSRLSLCLSRPFISPLSILVMQFNIYHDQNAKRVFFLVLHGFMDFHGTLTHAFSQGCFISFTKSQLMSSVAVYVLSMLNLYFCQSCTVFLFSRILWNVLLLYYPFAITQIGFAFASSTTRYSFVGFLG